MRKGDNPAQGEGIITKPSPRSVDDTLIQLRVLLAEKSLNLFSVVDHSGEARRVGQNMPNTKLVIFGSPAAGTPVMLASPLSALDLPLKILIWEDGNGATFLSYNDPAYLAGRHSLNQKQAAPLAGVEALVEALAE